MAERLTSIDGYPVEDFLDMAVAVARHEDLMHQSKATEAGEHWTEVGEYFINLLNYSLPEFETMTCQADDVMQHMRAEIGEIRV